MLDLLTIHSKSKILEGKLNLNVENLIFTFNHDDLPEVIKEGKTLTICPYWDENAEIEKLKIAIYKGIVGGGGTGQVAVKNT